MDNEVKNVIIITTYRGNIESVLNLPKGWKYMINNLDDQDGI